MSETAPEWRGEDAADEAAEVLRYGAEHFRALAENASDAIVTIDADDRILYVNRATERIFGYAVEELRRMTFTDLMPESMRERHREGVRRYLETGERRIPWTGVELPGLHRDGREVPLEITFGEAVIEGRHVFTGIMRDIRERKEAEAERAALLAAEREARENAEHAVQMRDEVLAIVSHDLRNPLNLVNTSASLLLDASLPEARRAEQLRVIRRSAERMERLIRDLLDVASIEAGRLSVSPAPLAVEPLLAEAMEALRPLAEGRPIELECEVAEGTPAVHADRDRLLQVLSNLGGNAIKFTDEGRVSLSARPRAETVEFAVADTGPGIPEAEVPHLFERYTRPVRSERSGAGLGLTISRGIVEAHEGRMWVETEEGVGSTFRFTIPRAEAPPAGKGGGNRHAVPSDGRRGGRAS